jgi:hypothetical protein
LRAAPGETVIVPVNIDTARPEDSTGMLEAVLALRFDPQVFTVSAADVHLGSLPTAGSGWRLISAVNSQTGEIGIDLFSATPISTRAGGSLVTVTLHVRDTAPPGTTVLNLVPEVNPNGQRMFRTAAADAQGTFVLHPAVTDSGADAGVDGRVFVPEPQVSGLSSTTSNTTSDFWVSQGLAGAAASEPLETISVAVNAVSTSAEAQALSLLEHAFGDVGQMLQLAAVNNLGLPSIVLDAESADPAREMAFDKALVSDSLDSYGTDWLVEAHLGGLGRVSRRGNKRPAGLLDGAAWDEDNADAAGIAEYFARESAKGGD